MNLLLQPVDYIDNRVWRQSDFFQVFPLDGGGYFSFLDLVGGTDDYTVAEATVTGKIFDRFRAADGRVDWERYDQWDSIEMGVWLNRWYYLPSTSRLYWLTGDERFAKVVREIVEQWRLSVPLPKDYPAYFRTFRSGFDAGNRRIEQRACSTWCDFQLGQRILVVYWVAFFLSKSASWDHDAWSWLADLMVHHARLLHWADREGDFEPGNHQMLRGFALLHAAAMLAEAEERESWWELGERLMTMHATGDFTSEGISREGSFSYQLFLLAQFVHAAGLARAMGRTVPPEWSALLVKMARFLEATATPGLTTPVVNDGYEAELGPILDICRKQIAGFQLECGAKHGAKARLETFAHAGVAVLDAAEEKMPLRVLAECIPPYGHSGHWHAGKPTVLVWVAGRLLLGDCGCPNYDDPLYGTWYRRSPAHFTVTVDTQEDAEFVSDVRWDRPPSLNLARCDRTESGAVLLFENNGFRRLEHPVDYVRQLEYRRGEGLLIRDSLKSLNGVAAHTFRLHVPFLVPEVRPCGQDCVTATVGERRVWIRWHVTGGKSRAELTRRPVSVGSLQGEYPYLQIEVGGVPETEFAVKISPRHERTSSLSRTEDAQ